MTALSLIANTCYDAAELNKRIMFFVTFSSTAFISYIQERENLLEVVSVKFKNQNQVELKSHQPKSFHGLIGSSMASFCPFRVDQGLFIS